MKKNNILKLTLLIFALFNFYNVEASASDNIFKAVNGGDGYLVCDYRNDAKGSVQVYYFPMHEGSKSGVSLINGFSINNQWAIVVDSKAYSTTAIAWGETGGDGGARNRAFSKIFGESKIYFCENASDDSCSNFVEHFSESNFECTKYVFADFSHDHELCFTNDANGCGGYEYTTLWGTGSAFKVFDETISISTNTDQLIANKIKKTSGSNILSLLNTEDFKNEITTTTFRNKIEKHIEQEFFFNNSVPNFVHLSTLLSNIEYNKLFSCDDINDKVEAIIQDAGNNYASDLENIKKNVETFRSKYSTNCSKVGQNLDGSGGALEQLLDYDFSNTCHDFASTIRLGGTILTLAKILIPFFIIGKTMLNLIGIITSGNPSDISKLIGKTLRSVAAAMIIFFVPTVINIIFGAINSYQNVGTDPVKVASKADAEVCRACIFEPFSNNCKQYLKSNK